MYAKQEYLNAEEREQKELNNLYSEMKIATNDNSQITVDVKDLRKIMQEEILNSYPVGSIYISTQGTNPSEFLGGTWESYGEGRTLVGVGTGTDENGISKEFAVNNRGGEYSHTITIEEMPSKNHTVSGAYSSTGSSGQAIGGGNTGATASKALGTSSSGESNAHNNIQPYIVTYMWKRVE